MFYAFAAGCYWYCANVSCFFFLERLKPGCEAYLEEIEAEIKCKLEKVAWLPNLYSLPPQIQIANSKGISRRKGDHILTRIILLKSPDKMLLLALVFKIYVH